MPGVWEYSRLRSLVNIQVNQSWITVDTSFHKLTDCVQRFVFGLTG